MRYAMRQDVPVLVYTVDSHFNVWEVFSGMEPSEEIVYRGCDQESADVVAEALRQLQARRRATTG